MLLQFYFPFLVLNHSNKKDKMIKLIKLIKQTNYYFQESFHISCINYLLSQIVFHRLYLMTVKLPKVRNNISEETNRQWD